MTSCNPHHWLIDGIACHCEASSDSHFHAVCLACYVTRLYPVPEWMHKSIDDDSDDVRVLGNRLVLGTTIRMALED